MGRVIKSELVKILECPIVVKNKMSTDSLKNKKTGNNIIAVLPAFNEEISIGSIVLHAKKHTDQVIVVDDGSSDRTFEIAKMAGAKVIRHPDNIGKGAALKTGFSAALQNGTKIIVTMDTDGQNDPDEIPKLIAPLLAGDFDMVNGSRYIRGKCKNTPKYRRLGQTILDKATNLSSGIIITDTQSGYRAYAAHTVPVFRFREKGFGIESEMLKDAAKADLKIKEVEVGVRYDVDGSTKNPISHGVQVLFHILKDTDAIKSLYIFIVPGLIAAGAGVEIGLGLIYSGDISMGPGVNIMQELFMFMLMLVGILMILIGIMLYFIYRKNNNPKGNK